MIDPKELRIGNWVYDTYTITNEKTPVQVLSLHEFDGRNSINASSANDYYPIPLSPEVLKAFGFESPAVIKDVSELFFLTTDTFLGFRLQFEKSHEDGYYICESLPLHHIQYAHQLQNLYFALTNTELTYNPNQP